jgi:hypothetical protein
MKKTEKKSPFKTVGEQLPFYPDLKADESEMHEPFIGIYESSSMLGESEDITKRIPVYTFVKIETGEKYFVCQSYTIKKTLEAAKKEFETLQDIVFQFVYKGKGLADGKPFNLFTTGYCTLEDYESSINPKTK